MTRVTLIVSLFIVVLMAYGCSNEPITTEDEPQTLLAPEGPPGSEYKFFIGNGLNHVEFPLPGKPFPKTVTKAADGSRLVLNGVGRFTLGPGKSIEGHGGYAIWNAADELLYEDGWEATQLESFHTYGSSPEFPSEWGLEAGVMHAKIELGGLGPAHLTVWCRLPEVDIPPPVRKGIRVHTAGPGWKWDFNEGVAGHSATLFVRLHD